MLVLSRKQGQQIRIGDDIVITIVQSGKNVRVGVDAPREVQVIRRELESDSIPGYCVDVKSPLYETHGMEVS